MTTYITSDPHFSHFKCATVFRPFSSVEEHNQTLIDNWRKVVRDGDTVWLLGDSVMGQFDESIHLLGELTGEIHLVPGNHDRVHPAYRIKNDDDGAKRQRFREMYEQYVIIEDLEVQWSDDVLLCHFPCSGDHTSEDRYSEYRPTFDKVVLHGHVHDAWRVRGNCVNVGVDAHDFTPIPIDYAISLAGGYA